MVRNMKSSKYLLGVILGLLLCSTFVMANLSVSSVNYTPSPAYPGTYIDFTAHIYNDSYSVANNVELKFDLSKNNSYSIYPFSFDSNEAAIKKIGNLPAYQSAIVNYRILVDPSAFDGTYTVNLSVHDEDSPYKTTPFTITVLNRKPVLSVVSITPDEMSIGKKTELTLLIKNNGSSTASDISIGVGEDRTVTAGGTVVERTIIPIGAAFSHIEKINPNETIEVKIPLMINPGTTPKAYFVPIKMEFYDENKTKYSDVDYVGIKVFNESGMNATIASVTPLITPGTKSKITLDISNTGLGIANAVLVKLTSTTGTLEPAEYYIGSLNPDNLYSIQTDLIVPKNTAPGIYQLNAQITYKDAFGEEKNEKKIISFTVHSNEELGITQELDYGFIYIILGIVFVLGLGFLFKDNIKGFAKRGNKQ